MEPVEINAGGFYLRGLRADGRVDDTPAIAEILGLDADAARARIAELDAGWSAGSPLSWAVCEQTDPTCVALIVVEGAGHEPVLDAAPSHPDPEATFAGPVAAVQRFAASLADG